LFEELARPLLGRPGLRRGIHLAVRQGVRERDRKLDLLAAQRLSGGQE